MPVVLSNFLCIIHNALRMEGTGHLLSASDAVGLAFLRCGGASRKTHVAHRRIKIERVHRRYLYLTAWEAALLVVVRDEG
jgi:hypothetical protein